MLGFLIPPILGLFQAHWAWLVGLIVIGAAMQFYRYGLLRQRMAEEGRLLAFFMPMLAGAVIAAILYVSGYGIRELYEQLAG